MSEVVYLIRHVLDKPVHERTAQMKNVLAMQTWVQAGERGNWCDAIELSERE